jgi:hypothetical protein
MQFQWWLSSSGAKTTACRGVGGTAVLVSKSN